MDRPTDCTQCYRDIFFGWDADDVKTPGDGWEREERQRRTIRRFAALKFHDYVGSNFGWSRGWCSQPASCPCLYVSLERPRVATAETGGRAGWEGRFRETIRNQRSGKWVPSLPEHAPGESRYRRWEIHGKGYGVEGWRNSMTDGGAKIFCGSGANFFSANESAVGSLLRYALSYFLQPSSRLLFLIRLSQKVALFPQIFAARRVDGEGESERERRLRYYKKIKKFSTATKHLLYTRVYVHLTKWTLIKSVIIVS